MSVITVTRPLNVPAASVWAQLSRFGNIADWNPNLASSNLLEGSPAAGIGTLRQCNLGDGKNWIRERVTEWTDGESYTVDIYEGTFPLKTAFATLGARPTGDGTCEAFMTMEYTPKMGFIGRLMDVMMLRSMMQGNMNRVLAGLEAASSEAASV